MGNDGGVIAVKRKFMRHAQGEKKQEKAEQDLVRLQKIKHCAISEEPLLEPIVACRLGNLYNKQVLLEHLLARTIPDRFQHLKSLRDVVSCNFSHKDNAKSDQCGEKKEAFYYCPISMVEFNGCHQFVVLESCGCVISAKAWKELRSKECLVCGTHLSKEKTIPLFLSAEEYTAKQQQILNQKATKKEKKAHCVKETGQNERRKIKKRKAESDVYKRADVSKSITNNVSDYVRKEKNKNAVFASLFKSGQEKKNANDLMMTVGGMRYTLS
uniref:Uncharacterized protein AlNc14C10G1290 n=1 Tax=Albugo laibachii Nc14 TaxID=890382 RepID=F0W2Q2_9STRA|nr:conserved hypothetical protein [Albugo laibachii Nc14]|eukprot:CCA15338.1 conserved hypothetical protein [Albugo laibachii Nc14]